MVGRNSKIDTDSFWLTTVQSDDGAPIRVVSVQIVTCSLWLTTVQSLNGAPIRVVSVKIVTCSLWLTTVQSNDGVPIRITSGKTVTCSIYEPPARVRSLAALLSWATGQECTLCYLLFAKIGVGHALRSVVSTSVNRCEINDSCIALPAKAGVRGWSTAYCGRY